MRAVFLLVLLAVGAAGCARRCDSVDGIPVSETFSFDLLRPTDAAQRAAERPLTIDRIQVFEEENAHWDMDAACRFKSLPMRAELRDAKRIAQFLDAVRDDVGDPAATDGLADCRPRDALYHVFVRHQQPNEIGYLLVKPCGPAGQPDRGMMTSYSADGDVSLRGAARTIRAISAN